MCKWAWRKIAFWCILHKFRRIVRLLKLQIKQKHLITRYCITRHLHELSNNLRYTDCAMNLYLIFQGTFALGRLLSILIATRFSPAFMLLCNIVSIIYFPMLYGHITSWNVNISLINTCLILYIYKPPTWNSIQWNGLHVHTLNIRS